jgi:WD40 repeat protein
VHDPWGAAENLGKIINTGFNEGTPSLSRDEHWMFFNSNRAGSSDIWVSWRDDVHDGFGWRPPTKLDDPGVNSSQFEAGASYFENEHAGLPQLFLGKGASAGTSDIYVSELQNDGSFGAASIVPELSSGQADQRPSIRFDGLEIFFVRSVSPGNFDLFVSSRTTVFDAWDVPTNLGPIVNSAGEDAQPHIAADRQTLFFVSVRPEGCGSADLYMTTRTKERGSAGDQIADDD